MTIHWTPYVVSALVMLLGAVVYVSSKTELKELGRLGAMIGGAVLLCLFCGVG